MRTAARATSASPARATRWMWLLINAYAKSCQSLRVSAGTAEQPITVSVTVSIGVAAFDQQGATQPIAQLLKRADAALYAAKHAGRNRVQAAESGAKN